MGRRGERRGGDREGKERELFHNAGLFTEVRVSFRQVKTVGLKSGSA